MYRAYKNANENSPPYLHANNRINMLQPGYRPVIRAESIMKNGPVKTTSNNSAHLLSRGISPPRAQFKMSEVHHDVNSPYNMQFRMSGLSPSVQVQSGEQHQMSGSHSHFVPSNTMSRMPSSSFHAEAPVFQIVESHSSNKLLSNTQFPTSKFNPNTKRLRIEQPQMSHLYAGSVTPPNKQYQTFKSSPCAEIHPEEQFPTLKSYSDTNFPPDNSRSIVKIPSTTQFQYSDIEVSSNTPFKNFKTNPIARFQTTAPHGFVPKSTTQLTMSNTSSNAKVQFAGPLQMTESYPYYTNMPSDTQLGTPKSGSSNFNESSEWQQFQISEQYPGNKVPSHMQFRMPESSLRNKTSAPIQYKALALHDSIKSSYKATSNSMGFKMPAPRVDKVISDPKLIAAVCEMDNADFNTTEATYIPRSSLRTNKEEQNILFQSEDTFVKYNGMKEQTNDELQMDSIQELSTIEKTGFLGDNSGIIHLIGTVEYGAECYRKMRKKLGGLSTFQVIACLERVELGKYPCEKILFLYNDDGGFILQGVYYEVDRPLPYIRKGQFLSCTGRLTAVDKMEIYDVQLLTEVEYSNIRRALPIINDANRF